MDRSFLCVWGGGSHYPPSAEVGAAFFIFLSIRKYVRAHMCTHIHNTLTHDTHTQQIHMHTNHTRAHAKHTILQTTHLNTQRLLPFRWRESATQTPRSTVSTPPSAGGGRACQSSSLAALSRRPPSCCGCCWSSATAVAQREPGPSRHRSLCFSDIGGTLRQRGDYPLKLFPEESTTCGPGSGSFSSGFGQSP